MKKTLNLKSGAVYKRKRDDSLFMVFACDGVQLFYTHWIEGKGWAMYTYPKPASLRISFPRYPVWFVADRAEFVREEECNPTWLSLVRPDLPFNLLRSKTVTWEELAKNSDEAFLRKHFNDLEQDLNTSQVVLMPLRKNGNYMKPVKVESKDGRNLNYKEVLLTAINAQHDQSKAVYEGVGLHRNGLEKGIPSYYIGGYVDAAGYLKED
jgi:hypothetical protein